ncbi:MAG: CRTAC1 family protein [Planctomycetales bacterium]
MTCPFRHVWIPACLAAVIAGCRESSTPDAKPTPLRNSSSTPNPEHDAAIGSTGSSSLVSPAKTDRAPRPDDWFEDVTLRSGVRFTVNNGRDAQRKFMIEGLGGGGVAMVDYDSDGDIDLLFTGGGTISPGESLEMHGQPPGLFRNAGGWQFDDVSHLACLTGPLDYSQGCSVTDFNVDGFPDLLVCCFGASRLFANQGDGSYADAGEVLPLPPETWSTGAAWGDIDRDGLPDLFLLSYADWTPATNMLCYSPDGIPDVCSPRLYTGTRSHFFHNQGDGRFEETSEQMGLVGNCFGLGVLAADINADGWIDFFIGSDSTPNQLYLGGPAVRFTEAATEAGVATGVNGQSQGSMGVDAGDYDGDGLIDLWVVNFDKEDASLYRNLGGGTFEYSTFPAGLAGHKRMRSGFGTSLCDFDGDGWLDIFIFNGNPLYEIAASPWKQSSQLFRNARGRRFQNITASGGPFFEESFSGRGSATGDLDDDGAPDLAAAPLNDPVRLLRNRQSPNNFVSVELRARRGEPDATGARLSMEFSGRSLVRFVVRGAGYFSQSDPRILFPLSAQTQVADILVEWPGRGRERFRGLAARDRHRLIEGRGEEAP